MNSLKAIYPNGLRLPLRPFEPEVITFASKYRIQTYLPNSILHNGGNDAGALGEGMVWRWMNKNGMPVDPAGAFDYDLVSKGGRRIEVKTVQTKKKFVDLDDWTNIEDRSTRGQVYLQDCDVYIHCRVNVEEMVGTIIGFCTPMQVATRWRMFLKGEHGEKGWVASHDCASARYDALCPLSSLEDYLRKIDPKAPRMRYSLHPV